MQLTVADLPRAKRPISVDEARRAIYIDFEGRINERPVLLGATYSTGRTFSERKTVLVHSILDSTFRQIPTQAGIAPVRRYDTRRERISQSLNMIVGLARSRDRLIVSYSHHDAEIALQHVHGVMADEFAHRFRDGKATAKRWKREYHPDIEFPKAWNGRAHSLANYMQLIGYELPDAKFGVGRTGENLRKVREALELHGEWDRLTGKQQDCWREVVGHNIHDCLGLRSVVTHAAHELEASTRSL